MPPGRKGAGLSYSGSTSGGVWKNNAGKTVGRSDQEDSEITPYKSTGDTGAVAKYINQRKRAGDPNYRPMTMRGNAPYPKPHMSPNPSIASQADAVLGGVSSGAASAARGVAKDVTRTAGSAAKIAKSVLGF